MSPIIKEFKIFGIPYRPGRKLKPGSVVKVGEGARITVLTDESVKLFVPGSCSDSPFSRTFTEGGPYFNREMKRMGIGIRWKE